MSYVSLTRKESNMFFRPSLAHWCFGSVFDLPQQCRLCKQHGLQLDLVPFENWQFVLDSGVALSCVLADMGKDVLPFVPGFNDPQYAERTYAAVDTAIDRAAAAQIKYVLVFTGFNTGEEQSVQFQRIVEGYTKPKGSAPESLVKKAERLGVTLIIEMLNTTGDEATWKGHPGYLGDNTAELIESVIKPIGSPNFLLAFDVYHVVMMDENPLAFIELYGDYIGYVHVAGVMSEDLARNRGELALEGQVIDYEAVFSAMSEFLPADTFVLFEYIPTSTDPAQVERDLVEALTLLRDSTE